MSPAQAYVSIDADFPAHPKARKLARLLQDPHAWALVVALWCWAAKMAPDGDLSDIDAEEIESVCGYARADGALYRALVEIGFIDEKDAAGAPCRRLHNWLERGRTGYALERLESSRDRWRRNKAGQRGDVSEESARTNGGQAEDSARSPLPSRFTVHGSRSPGSKNPSGSSAEPGSPPPADDSTVVFRIPMTASREYPVTTNERARWQELYPAVDVSRQLERISRYLNEDKPMKKKAKATGVRRFVDNWLNKEQESAGRASSAPSPRRERDIRFGHAPAPPPDSYGPPGVQEI